MPDFTNAAFCALIDDATMFGDDTSRRVDTMTRERGNVLGLSCPLFLYNLSSLFLSLRIYNIVSFLAKNGDFAWLMVDSCAIFGLANGEIV